MSKRNLLTVSRAPRRHSRDGSTLLITLLMTVVVIGLVALAGDHLTANQTTSHVEAQRQRAQVAAESFIGLIERKLYDLASVNTAELKKNLTLDADNWFNLRGFDAGGAAAGGGGPATTAIYLEGCAMRWRLEPVKLMARTNTAAAGQPFFVNSERDPDLQHERRTIAGVNLIDDEAQHLYFRIVVEAYALKDPQDLRSIPWEIPASGVTPTWDSRGRHTAMAQAQRVIQFEDVNAFRYLFNYVADGPTGDLEFNPATPVTIHQGGLRSNERVFVGSSVTIGSATEPIPVEAANGIFRLKKSAIYEAGVFDARNVSTSTQEYNPSGTILLNDIALTATADSRNGLDHDRDQSGQVIKHHEAVQDNSPDRPVSEDLATYQAWNTGFLTAHNLAGPGQRVYQYPNGAYTIRPRDDLYDSTIPVTAANSPTVVPGIYATDLPIFAFPNSDRSDTFTDIWPFPQQVAQTRYGISFSANVLTDRLNPYNPVDAGTGLLKAPMPFQPWSDPPVAPPTPDGPRVSRRGLYNHSIGGHSTWGSGLVIRERGRQTTPATANPRLATEGAHPASDLAALNEWMKANYVVYLGRRKDPIGTTYESVDITETFFDYSLTPPLAVAPTTVRQLMAHEDVFTNRRDQAWFISHGLSAGPVYANALTLNLDRFLYFLRQPTNDLIRFPNGGNYENYFNGLIYLERNPRYFMDATGPYAHPLAPNGVSPFPMPAGMTPNNNPLLGPIPVAPVVGMVDSGPDATITRGTPDSWTVYPTTHAVRIDRAYNSARRSLTIITPNTCYLWGDFNTAQGDDIPPCGVYADTVIALSNSWRDSNSASGTLPAAATRTTYRAAIVTHNVPTDAENAASGGSGGAQNILRFLEDWTGKTFTFVGCVVVPGRARYTRSPINDGNTVFSREPNYDYTYNVGLLTSPGQPPAAQKTTRAKRVLSTVMASDR